MNRQIIRGSHQRYSGAPALAPAKLTGKRRLHKEVLADSGDVRPGGSQNLRRGPQHPPRIPAHGPRLTWSSPGATGRPRRPVAITATRAASLLPLRLRGWAQLDAALAHEPLVLKATSDPVEAGGVLDAELLGRLGKRDPRLIYDQR